MSGDSWTVEVICTDRGQHKREWLAEFETYQRDDGTVEFRRITARHPKREHHTFVPAVSNAEDGTPVSRSHTVSTAHAVRVGQGPTTTVGAKFLKVRGVPD
jgi:hypothetical protein